MTRFARTTVVLGILGLVGSGLVFYIAHLRNQAQQQAVRDRAERRQKMFDRVKQGDSTASVFDSQLLPMLADDAECRLSVTGLEFGETEIDPVHAESVAQLENVTSISFYCTRGTEAVLVAARQLPIESLYFEMPDLPIESYLMLSEFPKLKLVHIEHVVDDAWIERLKFELPGVSLEIPFPSSKEPQGSR